jgi:hypothetical protein
MSTCGVPLALSVGHAAELKLTLGAAAASSNFRGFLIITHPSKETAMPKKVKRSVNVINIVTELAKQRLLWEPLVSYDPVDRYYVGLARDPEFEAWLLTWLPYSPALVEMHQYEARGDLLHVVNSQLAGVNW